MRWDSNPRWGFPHAGFQDQSLKPLGHPSLSCVILRRHPLFKRTRARHYAADMLYQTGVVEAGSTSPTCGRGLSSGRIRAYGVAKMCGQTRRREAVRKAGFLSAVADRHRIRFGAKLTNDG